MHTRIYIYIYIYTLCYENRATRLEPSYALFTLQIEYGVHVLRARVFTMHVYRVYRGVCTSLWSRIYHDIRRATDQGHTAFVRTIFIIFFHIITISSLLLQLLLLTFSCLRLMPKTNHFARRQRNATAGQTFGMWRQRNKMSE